jgi:beta-glucanase (GH16 family)
MTLRRLLRSLLSAGCLLLITHAIAQSPAWTLVWSDEFNQPDGSSPDPGKWTFDIGGGGWGNNELEYYTSRTNNARIVGGCLVIEADQESYGGSSYTSARLKTQGKCSWTYGRMEARIKLPRGQGLWPAFWSMGTNITSVGWPNCGEIDIMENIGREPTLVHGTMHGPGFYGSGGIGNSCSLPGSPVYANDFHVFALEWTTNELKWFVDGYQYFSGNPASLPSGGTWVFTQPEFLLLNLAVGGNWGGNPDATAVFPQQMLVDYVRVYAPTNLPPSRTNLLSNSGFEAASLANWSPYGNGNNTVQESIANVPVRNGTNVFKVFGQFSGSVNYSGAYQDIPASAGQSFVANGWLVTPNADELGLTNTAWIEVSFRDAAANMLALYRSAIFTAYMPPGLWLNFPVTGQYDPSSFNFIGSVTNLVAPANTSFVRYQLVFQQPAMAGGSVLFDDLNLSPAATVPAIVPVAATRAGTNLNLTFPTYLGLPYQVNWKNALADASWSVLTNLIGTGSSQTVTVNLQAAARFFRITRISN